MLKMNVVVLDDLDGKITPEEFDEEISDLSMIEVEKLMNDILMHPIHYIKGSHIYYIIFPSSERFISFYVKIILYGIFCFDRRNGHSF